MENVTFVVSPPFFLLPPFLLSLDQSVTVQSHGAAASWRRLGNLHISPFSVCPWGVQLTPPLRSPPVSAEL